MNKTQKISLTLSLVGILILIFLSSHLEPEVISISNITEKNLDEKIKIIANITEIRNFKEKNFQLITLKDSTGSITGTTNAKNLSINQNQTYIILGKVSEYNKTLQINIDKIFFLA